MRQVVETDRIANFGYPFLRMLQQFASGIQTIPGDELREGHPFASFEVGAERRTVHARFCRNIIQSNRMDVVRHDVCRDLLHPPHVPLDAHGTTGGNTSMHRSTSEWLKAAIR